jgi:hypothetical protein
MREMTYW